MKTTINMQAELEQFNAYKDSKCYTFYANGGAPKIVRIRHFANLDAAEQHMSKLGITVAEFKWFIGFDDECEKAPWVVFTGKIQDFHDGKCSLEYGTLPSAETEDEAPKRSAGGEPIVIHAKAADVKIPQRKSVCELLAENKGAGEKVELVENSKAAKITLAGVARCLIFAGFSNAEVWKIVQNVFDLDEKKRTWPAWFRSEIRRKNIDAAKFELGKYWTLPQGLLEFVGVQRRPTSL